MAAVLAAQDQAAAEMSELRCMFGRFMVTTGEALGRIESTLDQHGRRLDEHTRTLDEHGRKLDQQAMRLARIEEHLE